jgi:hypothetical protein
MSAPENITLKDAVIHLLQSKPGEDFKSRDLAIWLKKDFSLRFEKKEVNQLAAEISSGSPKWAEKHPEFHRSEDTTPLTYWWEAKDATDMKVLDAKQVNVTTTTTEKESEKELYPLLAQFLYSRPRKIYPKRIDEKKSSNSFGENGNKWLHPDLVGLEDMASGWNYEIKEWTAKAGAQQAKLWSFEVKQEISRGTVRKDYFQAVSNSTWANYGYLVAPVIKPNVISELHLLNELHGIGVIELKKDSPEESIIRIPARERHDVDWGTCNRIAAENDHFKTFISLIAEFYVNRKTSKKEWDIPPESLVDEKS